MLEIVRLIGIGIVLGIANVIPGVSGGTIAVVFGVYDRLIGVITVNVRKILSEWKFWLPLLAGAGGGIFLFSKVIKLLLERFPVQTGWFFVGIILGSIPMLYLRTCRTRARLPEGGASGAKGTDGRRIPLPHWSSVLCCVAALLLMVALAVLQKEVVGDSSGGVETAFSVALAVKLFLALALAAVAMIVPGISGSFLMIVVGVYGTVITAVADLNLPLLVPAALGILAGLLAGSSLIRFLLARAQEQTYGAILGLVLGSAYVIFPGFGAFPAVLASLVCAAAGFALSFVAGRK